MPPQLSASSSFHPFSSGEEAEIVSTVPIIHANNTTINYANDQIVGPNNNTIPSNSSCVNCHPVSSPQGSCSIGSFVEEPSLCFEDLSDFIHYYLVDQYGTNIRETTEHTKMHANENMSLSAVSSPPWCDIGLAPSFQYDSYITKPKDHCSSIPASAMYSVERFRWQRRRHQKTTRNHGKNVLVARDYFSHSKFRQRPTKSQHRVGRVYNKQK